MDFFGRIGKFFVELFASSQSGNQNMAATTESIDRDLIPKIKALCRFPSENQSSPPGAAKPIGKISHPKIQLHAASTRSKRLGIVAIGVSTGGPEALAKLLPTIPARFPLPVVIAQHMPPIFTSLLANRLSAKCSLPVRECKTGDLIEPGCIWIAPGDYHMVVQEDGGPIYLRTHQEPRENFCRPSVDVLFRSIAEVYGAGALGIILTGMGQDGLKGCEALSAAGSPIIVQDEASSVVWGMPGFVARAGLAEKIMPLNQIGAEISHRVTGQSLVEARL